MKNKHSKILEIYIQKMKYLNYSKRTIETYAHYLEKFLTKTDKYHHHLNASDFKIYLEKYEFSSVSQQNQIINALRFLYNEVLNKKYTKVSFNRPRKEKSLPQVIEKDFLIKQIEKIKNLKHKAIISLGYSTGLRVSEVINLKITDIDSSRMIIHIRKAKGKKDRLVPLSENILMLLRLYFKKYRPKEYMFNGQNSLQYSANSCNKIVKRYIGKQYHFHLLRHSCFTSLIECGTDIRIIQKLAGHSNIKTTEIYTHISTQLLSEINLPL